MPRRGIETTLKINGRSRTNTPQTPRAEALDERGRGGTASVSTTGPPHRRTGENINSLPCVLPLARGNNLGCVTVRTKLTRGLKAPVSQTVSIQCEGHTHDNSVQRHFHHLGCRNAAWKLTPNCSHWGLTSRTGMHPPDCPDLTTTGERGPRVSLVPESGWPLRAPG